LKLPKELPLLTHPDLFYLLLGRRGGRFIDGVPVNKEVAA
jgi:hypothetical protein